MSKTILRTSGACKTPVPLPFVIEQEEDGGYVIECPVLKGCYTQGDTLDEAFRNIQEVIELLAEEEECQRVLDAPHPSIGFFSWTSYHS